MPRLSLFATAPTYRRPAGLAARGGCAVAPSPSRNKARRPRSSSSRNGAAAFVRSALLRAVARRDLLLGRVLGRSVLDHRVEDRQVGLVVARDDLPLLAVPLL